MNTIDTKTVSDRRPLTFPDFNAVRRDLDALEAARTRGTVEASGNWTAGQIFAHLAAFMEYPFDGYPDELQHPPFFVRAMLRVFRKKFLESGMPAGVRIPRLAAGTTGADPMEFEDGLARLRKAMDRMERNAPFAANPAFGSLSHQQWIQLNCRHAELHLSFLHPPP
ncbi:MAG: DUF1569 domain-containing protein [Phycisphaerales bacterium]|nr:DUF1569 domain-containing protein [Phycisphaerales bacterium]